MLYISSRSKTDSFTAHRTLCADRAPDGGVFIPYKIPVFTTQELQALKGLPFGQIVATVLNLFFACKLTAWDVDVCAGRTPIRIKEVSRRLFAVECFHNPAGNYEYLEVNLYKRLAGADAQQKIPAWAKIAIRISVLFGMYSVIPDSLGSFDISVNTGDFTEPMAAWYAKKMGMPIDTIICSCNDNGAFWDFIQRGEMSTAIAFPRSQMPDQVEGLVYHAFGTDGAIALANTCLNKGTFRLEEDQLSVIGMGLAASVIGKERIVSLVRSVYRTNSYFITESAAVSVGGLQDYRASTGVSRNTLIFMDSSPTLHAASIAAIIGITENDVLKAY